MKVANASGLALVLAWAMGGCSPDSAARGSLMLAISTDMYIDKDVSRVDIIVQPERGPMQSTQVNLFPELEGQFLPGTFSIIEGSEPGQFVRVRVIARQGSRARVVREAALKVPRQRTALLSMPIQWLCDGQVRQDGQLYRSDCEEGYTCVSGACQPEAVDEASLPDYQIEEVFGGGDATGGGSCFDTLECFSVTEQPALDLESCRLASVASDDLNVAVALPPGGDGHCSASECLIPLDRSELTGWFAPEAGGSVRLPSAVCERVRAGGARVLTSTECQSKAPGTPTCGPWTLVGSAPGSDLNPGVPSPVALDPALIGELEEVAARLASELGGACGALAQLSPKAEPTPADLDAICEAARVAIEPLAPLTWHHRPSRCSVDHVRQLQCEAGCDPSCDPGTLEQRCVASGTSGICTDTCESRVCLSDVAAPSACVGGCAGSCEGQCEGSCLGQCQGACATSPDGFCEGPCEGTCLGLCQGRCTGTCEGRCDADPNLPAPVCGDGARCLGECAGALTSPSCDGRLGPSPCPAEPGCVGSCQAEAALNVSCDVATVWVMPKPGLDAVLRPSLVGALSTLVNLRDGQSFAALDEATRMLDRSLADPLASVDQVARIESAKALLAAVSSNSTSLLARVGPERAAFMPAPVGAVPACQGLRASGIRPGIDDFEDGDALLLPNDGRDGGWHVSGDGTGTLLVGEPLLPESGGVNGSGKAMHVSGSGFTEWGADLSFDLRKDSARYDASVHQGIKFWARGNNRLRFIVMQANLALGHPCATCVEPASQCGVFYASELSLTDAWTEYSIPWTSLVRDYPGGAAVGPDQLLLLQFEAPALDAFDFWIDDVSFF